MAQTRPPKVSVFIPTYNRYDSLHAALNAYRQQTFKDFELILVDGDSSDETPRLPKEYPDLNIRLVVVPEKKLTVAYNRGWQEARGEIVCRMDDDSIPDPGWLAAVVETMDSDPKIGGVTGPTIIPAEKRKFRASFSYLEKILNPPNAFWKIFGGWYQSAVLENDPYAVSKIYKSGTFSPGSNYPQSLKIAHNLEVDWLEACNTSLRRRLIERAGGWDENILDVGEWSEPDLCFRIRALGYKMIFNPRASIRHVPSQKGIFSARTKTNSRLRNFLLFYYRDVKLDSWSKFYHLSVNLWYMNILYTLGFLKTGNFGYLGCWPGTIVGFFENGIGQKYKTKPFYTKIND